MTNRTETDPLIRALRRMGTVRTDQAASRLAEQQAEIARLTEAEAESLGVIDLLSHRLAEVCIALKGEPQEGVLYSYHDLGELCAAMKAERDRLLGRLAVAHEAQDRLAAAQVELDTMRTRIATAPRARGTDVLVDSITDDATYAVVKLEDSDE